MHFLFFLPSLHFFAKLRTGKNNWRESQLLLLGGKKATSLIKIHVKSFTCSLTTRSRPLLLLFRRVKSSLTLAANLSRPESSPTLSSFSSMLYKVRLLLPPLGTLMTMPLVIHPEFLWDPLSHKNSTFPLFVLTWRKRSSASSCPHLPFLLAPDDQLPTIDWWD